MKGPNDVCLQEKKTSPSAAAAASGAYGSTGDISDIYRTTTETVQVPGTDVYLNGFVKDREP